MSEVSGDRNHIAADSLSEIIQVLVIDDEDGMRDGMSRILVRKGYNVQTAADGETGIALVEENEFDLVLVDLKMPGISGFEVTERINDMTGTRPVVVVVSALATVEAAVEVTRHGAFDFLVKPFTPSDLLQVVERAEGQRRLLRDRERFLTRLNEEQALSRYLITSMQEGVIVLNLMSDPVLVNPRAEYFLGITYKEGMTLEELGLDEEVFGALQSLIEESEATTTAKVAHMQRENCVIKVGIYRMLREGESWGIMIILHDVTDEWKAEQDKNRFLSMVVHELRSPLSAIINYLNIIESGMVDDQIDKLHSMIERCKVRGEDLLELIKDLLYLNKRDAGKVEKTYEIHDVAAVLKDQIEFLGVQAERRGVSVSFHTDPDTEYKAVADKGDLDRIFINLLSNGIKYNRENGSLDVTLTRNDKEIQIAITDSGIGMSEKDQQNLFQEFYRVRSPKTATITGTGLGLATVKRVLSEYNGRIDVTSTPDVGSTFTVTLPVHQQFTG